MYLRNVNWLTLYLSWRMGAEALDFIFCKGRYADRKMNHLPKVILFDIKSSFVFNSPFSDGMFRELQFPKHQRYLRLNPKLPKLNGLEVRREIRTDNRTHAIPVVMVRSSREDPDIKTAYELETNSYVVKPVEFDVFVEAMSSLGF